MGNNNGVVDVIYFKKEIMKNIHIIPTDQPSRLFKFANELHLDTIPKDYYKKYNINITSDEEIKENDFVYSTKQDYNIQKVSKELVQVYRDCGHCKKIILTTDTILIADGVQEIDNSFLEWFVKNPSCEFAEVKKTYKNWYVSGSLAPDLKLVYRIIIPQEEPKQDLEKEMFELEQQLDIPSSMRWHNSKPKQSTLEEAAEHNYPGGDVWTEEQAVIRRLAFKNGAKWQTERMYSEEDIKPLIDFIKDCESNWDCDEDSHRYNTPCRICEAQKVMEQFKKK